MDSQVTSNLRPSRRTFLKSAALAGVASVASGPANAQERVMPDKSGAGLNAAASVPRRPFGHTGLQVSILGMGGFHLGSTEDQQEANRMVGKAIDAGVNFFDNAWEYHEGKAEERMGIALQGKRDQV